VAFCEFCKTPQKDQTPGEERIQMPGKEKSRFSSPPGQLLFISRAGRLWYGIFPLPSLGWLPGCAPPQLLPTCSSAERGKLEKVLDFIATTNIISAISILLVLNPKHSSYWEEN